MQNLNILYESGNVFVLNKPSGLVVNRSETIKEITLQDLVSEYLKLKKGNLGVGDRAGIVHRLDRETSGVILIAKNLKTFMSLQKQFKSREIKKEYVSLVHGETPQKEIISEKIDRIGKFGKFGVVRHGREAETIYEKLTNFIFNDDLFDKFSQSTYVNKGRLRYLEKNARNYSLLSLYPRTGRTHQIRVHLKHMGYPIVSDNIYCPSKLLKFDLSWCPRLFLHAKGIVFRERGNSEPVAVSSDLPKDLKNAMLNLNKV